MSAILFGSISTIADTSELQRAAFNDAFQAHGLDWHWNRDDYVSMLQGSGGQKRIAEYASERGETVDAAAVHTTKSEIFQRNLAASDISPRSGVVETLNAARENGLKVALVTTTSHENIEALTKALGSKVPFSDFDLIVDSSSKQQPKPDKAAFTFAMQSLGEQPGDCIAIEDNVGGVHAAVSAGIKCVAFPNENTAHHNFGEARQAVDRLDFQQLRQLIPSVAA